MRRFFGYKINLIKFVLCANEQRWDKVFDTSVERVLVEIEEASNLLNDALLRGLAFEVPTRHGHIDAVSEGHDHTAARSVRGEEGAESA